MSSVIRLLLVDDHVLFRSGIRSLLQCYAEFDIVGEAGDGMEGAKRATQLQPDVVLLDLNMPGMSGCEAARLISQENPNCHVLMLTVSEEAEDLFDALRSGACGYLLKNIEAEALVAGIRAAAMGESVISPRMMSALLAGIRQQAAPSHPKLSDTAPGQVGKRETINGGKAGDGESLTPREAEILECVARGLSNKEIARELDIAESTVKIHVQNILRKLGLTSRVQAAVYAVERGVGLAGDPSA